MIATEVISNRDLHLLGATGTSRKESLNGTDYLVVPVVALMQGVIHAVNSPVPEYVPFDTIKRAAASWNGRPITVGHPVRGGKQCSASEPGIHETHVIGTIKNSRADEATKKLLQEAWIDVARAKRLAPEMYKRLAADQTEEVSVGTYVTTSKKESQYNGKQYKGEWTEATGDHLAFLPGGRGACSVEMGCGTHRAAMRVCGDHLEALSKKELKALALFDTPGEAASEEAAELIAYKSMRTMCDAVEAQYQEVSDLVDALIADEEEKPTETPAQEDAEEEIEDARCDAIRMLCYSMSAMLNNVVSVTYKLQQPDAPALASPKYMEQSKAQSEELRAAGDVAGHEFHGNQWHQFAGGTSAAEGKHGYSKSTQHGEYHISPHTTSSGRHAGYLTHFTNTKGALPGGLWHQIGNFRSPNAAKAAAAEHYAKNFAGGLKSAEGRMLFGKQISAKNMKTIQAAHDSAHDMHDHTTALGASCDGDMKALSNPEGVNQYTVHGASGEPVSEHRTLKEAQHAAQKHANENGRAQVTHTKTDKKVSEHFADMVGYLNHGKMKNASAIKPEGGKWTLYSKDGSRRLGTHDTEAEAKAQEDLIEAALKRRELSGTPAATDKPCGCGGHSTT